MKVRHRIRSLAGAASVVAMSMAAPSLAAAAAPGNAEPAARSGDAAAGEPTEILVTAQRRSERLQDVPISLAVVGGTELRDRSIKSFVELAPLVPNLTISNAIATPIIILRGVGSGAGSPSLDQSVVMFIDGVYAGNARQFQAPFLDIERLEILRGPQGALVGRNTSAGAVNIVTKRPTLSGLEGYASADYDFTLKGPSVEGGVNVPLTPNLAIRASGRYSDVKGYVYNTAANRYGPGRVEAVERVSALYDNGPFSLYAKYEHGFTRQIGGLAQPIAPTVGEYLDYTSHSLLTGPGENDRNNANNAVVELKYDLSGPTLIVRSAYSGFRQVQTVDADFLTTNLARSDFLQALDQYSQELQLVSPSSGALQYVAGAYYSSSSLYEQRTTDLFAPLPAAASTYRVFDQRERVLSVYGALTYHLTPELVVNGSLRYTNVIKNATYNQWSGATSIDYIPGTLVSSFPGRVRNSRVDPSVSVQYHATPDLMVYASFSQGSKSGGFQGAISNAAQYAFAFGPETSTSYEAGLKLTLPHAGYFNVAAFHTTYKGLQVSLALPSPNGLSAPFFTGNAPKARIIGMEAEFLIRPLPQLEISGSLGWLPTAKYIAFTAGPCYVGQTPNGSQPASCNLDQQRLGFAPKYSGSLTATFTQPLSGDYKVKLSVSPNFQGESERDFSTDPVLRQGPFLKLDARIALAAGSKWEIAAVGKNLTDKRTLAFGGSGGLLNSFLSPTARLGVIAPPREFLVQARFNF